MNLETLGKRLIYFGLLLLIVFTLLFAFNTTKLNLGPLNTQIWSHYSGVVSGIVGTIFSLVGVLFLIINLRTTRTISARQQVETRFFELVQLHRNNVNEMQLGSKKGRAVFIDIHNEFHEIYELVQQHYTQHESNKNAFEWEKDCTKIAYSILYFGVDDSSSDYLDKLIRQTIIDKHSQNKFIDICLRYLIDYHKQQMDKNETISIKGYLVYDGHQSRLGHYFRHLYQTVTYINKQTLFNYAEKYEYIKTLRAQLSTYEQALFLYNSISPLGSPWEIDKDIIEDNSKLVTKYNLVKNLPEGFTKSINPKSFYPDLFFEFDQTKTLGRIALEKYYR